jgi:hypothetical protein
MRSLKANEVSARSVACLGLDGVDLTAVESISCALRRAASFLCPCPRRALIRAVLDPLRGVHELAEFGDDVDEMFDALVGHGDLLELQDASQFEASGQLVFAAPPSFVAVGADTLMLLGVAPDGGTCLPEDIQRAIEHVNHVRIIRGAEPDLARTLAELGLIELKFSAWTQAPKKQPASEFLAAAKRRLAAASACGEIRELELLDPARPVHYYRGRWVEATGRTGCFVGRRPRAYGAPLWCFVEVHEGRALKLIDLPITQDVARGCDEAWHLQAAIDYVQGTPQRYRVHEGPGATKIVAFFSPIPNWARRRWGAVGEPSLAPKSLFSFKFSGIDVCEQLDFARDHLWLEEAREVS